MKSLFAIAMLLWLCAFSASAQQPPPQKSSSGQPQTASQDNSLYRQLVGRVKKGDATVDFVKLRDAFWQWLNDAKNQTKAPNRDAMVEAFKKQDYAKAAELAEVVLDYEFINRGLHLATEDAYRKVGDTAKADYHRDIAQKLMQALLSTGDGKTPETAYRVFSVREEYQIMDYLGYAPGSQALLSINNKPYDLLSGTDKKTGKGVQVYFDISSFF